MPEPTNTRTAATDLLRRTIANEPWLVHYALLRALEQLTLHDLIRLVEDVEDVAGCRTPGHQTRLEALVEERWGVRR